MRKVPSERILIVENDYYTSNTLLRCLSTRGYDCESAYNAEMALRCLRRKEFALVLCDILMPGPSGVDLLNLIRRDFPRVAVVMITGVDDWDTAVTCLELGAYGYMIKPLRTTEILINVANAFERRSLALLSEEYERNIAEQFQDRISEMRQREEELIVRLLSSSGYGYGETRQHVKRMGLYAAVLAAAYGWGPVAVEDIKVAAMLHDVGKLTVPAPVLRKTGPLTSEELAVITNHTEAGARILEGSIFPPFIMAGEVARSHHERWDGTGYPQGLSGDEIPEAARIVAICDVYDALMHHRPFRAPFSEADALALMTSNAESHFDPRIWRRFLSLLPEIRCIRQSIPDLHDETFLS